MANQKNTTPKPLSYLWSDHRLCYRPCRLFLFWTWRYNHPRPSQHCQKPFFLKTVNYDSPTKSEYAWHKYANDTNEIPWVMVWFITVREKVFTSSWQHRRYVHVDQWSWYVDHGHGEASDDGDHDEHGSKLIILHQNSRKWRFTFFNRSKSSRSLVSRPLEMHWPNVPSFQSFCLLRNQSGILYWRGLSMIVSIRLISSSSSWPAL